MRARIPIWAARPLFSSMAFLLSRSNPPPSSETAGRLARNCSQASSISAWRRPKPSSRRPMKRTVWITPPKGRVSKTARPAFMELKGTPGATSKGRRSPAVVAMCPATASKRCGHASPQRNGGGRSAPGRHPQAGLGGPKILEEAGHRSRTQSSSSGQKRKQFFPWEQMRQLIDSIWERKIALVTRITKKLVG